MIKYNFVLILSLLVIITGCKKDIDELDVTTEVTNPVEGTNSRIANFNGLVSGLDGAPILNANVEVNGEIVSTDQFGYFRFTEKMINNDGNLVKISKTGYFDSYKFVYPTSVDGYSFIRISIPIRNLSGVFNASNGGTIETNDGAKVTFGSNTIIDSNGNLYNGSVSVYAHWYDPTSEDLSLTMPGDLRATDALGNEVQLATFGMLAVELETPDGQPLNISEGNTAELTFPLEELADGAPNEIPLWYLDEESGIWKEEGQATKVGNTYVGEVSHFSFWNCDAPFPVIQIDGIIKDSDDTPLSNTRICMQVQGEFENGWTTSYGWTDQNGEYTGKIPQNEIILLSVKDNCGNVMYEEEIGPFDSDISMDPIIIDHPSIITISGMVTDCEGNLVTDGYIVFNVDNPSNSDYLISSVIAVDQNGNFTYTSDLCQNLSGSLQAYDFATTTFSNEVEFNSELGEDVDLGVISLCEQLDEFFIFSLDGEQGLYTELGLSIVDGGLVITTIVNNGSEFTRLRIPNITSGNNLAEFYAMSTPINYILCNEDCVDIAWNITNLGTVVGDYIEGTFEGEAVQDSLATSVDVSGSFRVAIDYVGVGASISGMVWEDLNANGIREVGEPPLANATVNTWNSASTLSTQTDANGQYSFNGLQSGVYSVLVDSSFEAGPTNQGGDDAIDNDFNGPLNNVNVTIVEGDNLENLDAGLVTEPPLECEANVRRYCNPTGAGWVQILPSGGTPPYTFTSPSLPISADSSFLFTGVAPGFYEVLIADAAGDICVSEFELLESLGSATVSVSAWLDENNNGVQDDTESYEGELHYVIVRDDSPDGNGISNDLESHSTITSSLDPRTYTLEVTAPLGYRIGATPSTPNPDYNNANIEPNQNSPSTGTETFDINGCSMDFFIALIPN